MAAGRIFEAWNVATGSKVGPVAAKKRAANVDERLLRPMFRLIAREVAYVNRDPAPKRIVRGSDSYTAIQKALTERLAAVESLLGTMEVDFLREMATSVATSSSE